MAGCSRNCEGCPFANKESLKETFYKPENMRKHSYDMFMEIKSFKDKKYNIWVTGIWITGWKKVICSLKIGTSNDYKFGNNFDLGGPDSTQG